MYEKWRIKLGVIWHLFSERRALFVGRGIYEGISFKFIVFLNNDTACALSKNS